MKFRQAPHQDEDPLPSLDPQGGERIGETVRFVAQVGIGQVAARTRLADPAQRYLIRKRSCRVAIHCLVRDGDEVDVCGGGAI